jgi:hypothetical protein
LFSFRNVFAVETRENFQRIARHVLVEEEQVQRRKQNEMKVCRKHDGDFQNLPGKSNPKTTILVAVKLQSQVSSKNKILG